MKPGRRTSAHSEKIAEKIEVLRYLYKIVGNMGGNRGHPQFPPFLQNPTRWELEDFRPKNPTVDATAVYGLQPAFDPDELNTDTSFIRFFGVAYSDSAVIVLTQRRTILKVKFAHGKQRWLPVVYFRSTFLYDLNNYLGFECTRESSGFN